ncbi:MAG: ferric reductase-like transmembrane domain-containing protein [Planctomycetota bacterium]
MTEVSPKDAGPSPFQPALGRQASVTWGASLVAGYLVLACLPVALALAARPTSAEPLWTELGLGAALLGFSLLALQPILAGRFHWLDRPFGLDTVMRFHKAMAILAAVLLLAHPVLLSLGAGHWQLLAFDTPWQVWLGKAALIVLVLGIGYALLVHVRRLEYQTWRRAHKGMVVVVVLGFLHSILLGHDVEAPRLLTYWSGLVAVAALVVVWRNVVLPSRGRARFRVADVRPESHDTYTLRLDPIDPAALPPRNPGQFMFLALRRPGRPSEEHPFTISASPTESGHLTVTIKESGDFTNTIARTRPGDEARIEHPFGRFSYVHHGAEAFVFIGGGVGITPLRSMLRCLADTGDDRPATLIYGNRTERDILFRDELADLPGHVRVVHVLSQPDETWDGERGHVTQDLLSRHAGDLLPRADVYLCGPPPMMAAVKQALRQLNVHASRVHDERFSL